MEKKKFTGWLSDLLASPVKAPLPILSFPAVAALGTTVHELVTDSDLQCAGMAWIAGHTEAAAAVSFMDLSVEAECFGAKIRFSDTEVPTVVSRVVRTEEGVTALESPAVGDGRTGIFLDAIRKAKRAIQDRPVLCGMIGPFSLAARLHGVSEVMMDCIDEPETVAATLETATDFLEAYGKALRDAGADGLLLAEPVSGLLSPAMEEEFSAPYVKKIVAEVQTDAFPVIYHNCGNNVPKMLDSIFASGAAAYHFGNVSDLCEILSRAPHDAAVMGNVDPASEFLLGTPGSVRSATFSLLERAGKYPNFVLSSGCDIPPTAPFANVDAFFRAAKEFYEKR